MFEALKTLLGACLAFGIFALPVCKILRSLDAMSEETYQKLKFAGQISFIVGCGSAVTMGVFEGFIENFINP